MQLQEALSSDLSPLMKKTLRSHLLEVSRREQQIANQKLEKQQQKIEKVKAVEENFMKVSSKMSQELQLKFEKVQKNKGEYIAKIVKKCKDRDKIVTKKQQQFKMSKKKSLNTAWKKAQQFNEDLQKYYKSKTFLSRTAKSFHQQKNHSVTLDVPQQTFLTEQIPALPFTKVLGNQSLSVPNTSKQYVSVHNNLSFYKNIELSPNQIRNRHEKQQKLDRSQRQERSSAPTPFDQYKEKSHDIFERFQLMNKLNEDLRIQQLGQKMAKISLTRQRKLKKLEKKQGAEDFERERNFTSAQFHTINPKKKQQKIDHRMHSEQSYKKQNKIKDRTNEAKQKRNQLFEQHLAQGQSYLQNIKIRHLKNVIAKNIAYNTLQKKLYIERLRKLDK